MRSRLYVKRPLPLITPRIEFRPASPPELPLITPRIEFTDDVLELQELASECSHSSLSGSPPHISESNSPSRHQSPASQVAEQAPIQAPMTGAGASLIRKPAGEPGRPGSGGFALDAELKRHGWQETDIDPFMNEVRDAAQTELNPTLSFRGQTPEVVQQICDRLSSSGHYPVLKNYEKCWPVRSALKLALKYRVEASRRTQAKKATERMRSILQTAIEE